MDAVRAASQHRVLADGTPVPLPRRASEWKAVNVYPHSLTKDNWEFAMYGDPANPRNGGHMPGVGRSRKTELPAGWTEAMFKQAVNATIDAPQIVKVSGTTLQRWREYNQVIFRVDTYPDPAGTGKTLTGHAFPVNGKGVIYNEPNGTQTPRPLDWSVIDGHHE